MNHAIVTLSRDGLHHTPENERHPTGNPRAAGYLRAAAVRSILVVVLPMTGCGSLERQFENRLLCTMAKDRAMVASMWGPIGIASNVRDADAAVMCKPG
jgi:hypothetical protein